MDGRRHDPLTDAALDRELDAALNVEPSPEFVARVRTRVVDVPVATLWFAGWRLAVAGSAIAMMALLAASGLWERADSGPAREASGRADVDLTAQVRSPFPPAAQPIAPGVPSTADSTPDVARLPSSNAMHASESHVVEGSGGEGAPFSNALVPPTQRLAIESLVARVRESQVVTAKPAEPVSDEEPPALVIEPIEIQSVAVVASLE